MKINLNERLMANRQWRRYFYVRKTGNTATQEGFTVIELMIATVVFSLVMLVIVFGVLSFSHDYFGGVNSSTMQSTARNVLNSVAESIQFSGTTITPTPTTMPSAGNQVFFCAGNNVYVYRWGLMYTGTPSTTNPGLYVLPGSCGAPSTIPVPNGKELLSDNMRITALTVSADSTGRLFTITLGLAYGDSDLLCNFHKNGGPGGCFNSDAANTRGGLITTDPLNVTNVSDVGCRQASGSQFCAHAGLSTTVSLRVAGGALN